MTCTCVSVGSGNASIVSERSAKNPHMRTASDPNTIARRLSTAKSTIFLTTGPRATVTRRYTIPGNLRGTDALERADSIQGLVRHDPATQLFDLSARPDTALFACTFRAPGAQP